MMRESKVFGAALGRAAENVGRAAVVDYQTALGRAGVVEYLLRDAAELARHTAAGADLRRSANACRALFGAAGVTVDAPVPAGDAARVDATVAAAVIAAGDAVVESDATVRGLVDIAAAVAARGAGGES